MKEKNNLENLIETSMKDTKDVGNSNLEITPLSEIKSRIRLKRRKQIVTNVIRPLVILLAFLTVAFLAIMLSDSPFVNAIKFDIFKMKYNYEGGTFKIDTTENDNYTILKNDENQLEIEFYDVISAKDRIDTTLYYPTYVPEQFRFDKINWHKDKIGTNSIYIFYKDLSGNFLRVIMLYLNNGNDGGANFQMNLVKEVKINNIEMVMFESDDHKLKNLTFVYDNIQFTVEGNLTESDLIKVVESIFN
ncbi:MAG: DUF4367 domain-containing protein [Clostridia bacterium]|nr:DUF4367 domain-containing protein [Clostridia bacterium]